MVRAIELTPEAILNAMNQGDFYASSGVTLNDVRYDKQTRKLELQIQPVVGQEFQTLFIGTRRDYDRTSAPRTVVQSPNRKPIRLTRKYSEEVGQVLAKVAGTNPSYQFTGDEWYVRAVVTSSQSHADPSFSNQKLQAWTQPFGWR